MKCVKCKKDNTKRANYCKNCGNKFSIEKKEKAKNKGFVPTLKKIDNAYQVGSLQIITGNIIFKIFVFLIILSLGIYNVLDKGSDLKILNSENYTVNYNVKDDEYYIILKKELNKASKGELHLDMYVPNKTEKIYIREYDEENNLISEKLNQKDDDVFLKINDVSNNYYKISDSKKVDENLKIYVYYGGVIDGE